MHLYTLLSHPLDVNLPRFLFSMMQRGVAGTSRDGHLNTASESLELQNQCFRF